MRNAVKITDPTRAETKKSARKTEIPLSNIMGTDSRKYIRGQNVIPFSFKLKKRSVGGKGLQDGLSFDDMKAIDDIVFGATD